jgi:hypothetical protein
MRTKPRLLLEPTSIADQRALKALKKWIAGAPRRLPSIRISRILVPRENISKNEEQKQAMQRQQKREWHREYKGRYVSRLSGWIIEFSLNDQCWEVFNPDSTSGRRFDSFPTFREAKSHYSNLPAGGAN